jgi:hypothetical protein
MSWGRIAYVGEWRDDRAIFVDNSNKGVTIIFSTHNYISPEDLDLLKEIISKQEG